MNLTGFKNLVKVVWDEEYQDMHLSLDQWNFLINDMEKTIAYWTEKEQMAIIMVYGLEDGQKHTLKEVGEAMGTGSRARGRHQAGVPYSGTYVEDLVSRGLRRLRKQYVGSAPPLFSLEELIASHEPTTPVLDKEISELDFSVRTSNMLELANIITVRDLVQKKEHELIKYRNFGRKSLNEVKDKLSDLGLSLGSHDGTVLKPGPGEEEEELEELDEWEGLEGEKWEEGEYIDLTPS